MRLSKSDETEYRAVNLFDWLAFDESQKKPSSSIPLSKNASNRTSPYLVDSNRVEMISTASLWPSNCFSAEQLNK